MLGTHCFPLSSLPPLGHLWEMNEFRSKMIASLALYNLMQRAILFLQLTLSLVAVYLYRLYLYCI